MTKYREILRLHSMDLSQMNIAASCGVSKKTVNKVLKAAREKGISWPLNYDAHCPQARRAGRSGLVNIPPLESMQSG